MLNGTSPLVSASIDPSNTVLTTRFVARKRLKRSTQPTPPVPSPSSPAPRSSPVESLRPGERSRPLIDTSSTQKRPINDAESSSSESESGPTPPRRLKRQNNLVLAPNHQARKQANHLARKRKMGTDPSSKSKVLAALHWRRYVTDSDLARERCGFLSIDDLLAKSKPFSPPPKPGTDEIATRQTKLQPGIFSLFRDFVVYSIKRGPSSYPALPSQ